MIGKWFAALSGAVVTVIVLAMAPVAMAEDYSPPYPRISAADLEPCRALFTTLKGQTVSYYRDVAQTYAPGGKYYSQPNDSNVATYNALADRMESTDAVAWWVKGFDDDGMGFGGVDSVYNDGSGNMMYMIANSAKGLDTEGKPIQPFVLDHQVGNLYSYADGNPASTCVDRIYMAKYEAMHANDATKTAAGDCFASPEAALACYNRRVEEIMAAHKMPGTEAGARATYQYMYALGNASMQALNDYKTALGDKYAPEQSKLQGVIDSSFSGCNKLSSTSANCPNEFP